MFPGRCLVVEVGLRHATALSWLHIDARCRAAILRTAIRLCALPSCQMKLLETALHRHAFWTTIAEAPAAALTGSLSPNASISYNGERRPHEERSTQTRPCWKTRLGPESLVTLRRRLRFWRRMWQRCPNPRSRSGTGLLLATDAQVLQPRSNLPRPTAT